MLLKIIKIFPFILILLMLFANSKVRVFNILCYQIRVLKNDKTDKISIWDFLCFILFPIAVALCLNYGYNFVINNKLAELLATVYAFVFTVLFGFAAVLISKISSGNKIEKAVTKETFVSVLCATLLSLTATILSIISSCFDKCTIQNVLSMCILSISFMIIMLLLMITKRTFNIFINTSND